MKEFAVVLWRSVAYLINFRKSKTVKKKEERREEERRGGDQSKSLNLTLWTRLGLMRGWSMEGG